MPYIEKRNGKWRAKVSWNDVDGKRHTKSKQGFDTKRQAMQWASEMEVAKGKNQISHQDPTFADYFLDWANTYKIPNTSANTQNRYRHVHGRIVDYFGQVKLSKVTRRQYQQFINEYGADHSKSTMQKVHGTIRSCVSDAMSEGIIHHNFTDRINLVWNDENTMQVEYLSVAEIKMLISSLLNGVKPNYTSRYMILCAIYTGLRLGEILALEWTDIDYVAHTISITKSYDYAAKRTKEPKTASSKRTVRVSAGFLDMIAPLKINHKERVFAPVDGSYISSSAVNKTLKKQLKACGLVKKDFHFHSLRHSHVALLLYEGVPLYAISKRLGHADMAITARKYAYLIDELRQKSDDRIEEILNELNAKKDT